MITIGEAIMIGSLYYLAVCDITPCSRVFSQAVFYGLVYGIIYGQLERGILIGATINALYIGLFSTGGNLPSDQGMAACFTIPLALKLNLEPEVAVSLALPFGVIGTFLDNLVRAVDGVFWRRSIKHIDDEKYDLLKYEAVILPTLWRYVTATVTMGLIAYLGYSNAEKVLSLFPTWLMNGLTAMGKILPGVGFIMATMYLGRKDLLPFAVIGFFLYKMTGYSQIIIGIFGAMVALLYVGLLRKAKE